MRNAGTFYSQFPLFSHLFVLKVYFSARLEGEAVLNDSPVGCQIRGKALPAGKGVLAPLPTKKALLSTYKGAFFE